MKTENHIARKKITTFRSEADEQVFWGQRDSTDFIDWESGKSGLFSNLTPSTKTISLGLPEALLSALKVLANKRDVPYQSLKFLGRSA